MPRARENDPLTELASLEAALERGGLARGYVLRGEERYFRERAIERLKRVAEARGFELCLHDAEEGNPDFQLSRLIDDLSGAGLFAAQRLVVVRQAGEHLRMAKGEESPLARAVLAFVHSPESAGCLVLSDASLRADHPLVQAIVAAGGSVLGLRRLWETPPPWKPDPRSSELVGWTMRRARELGLRLGLDQALYVAAATGNDLFALDSQLECLGASGGRDLRTAVRWTAGASPWAVADSLVAGELARGLSGIEALFGGGFQDKSGRRLVDAPALATMLVAALQRGVRSALELSRSLERGAPEGDALAEAGQRTPGERAALARARVRGSREWRVMLEEVAALERSIKSGGGVDANDFARFALRWSLQEDRRPQRVSTHG